MMKAQGPRRRRPTRQQLLPLTVVVATTGLLALLSFLRRPGDIQVSQIASTGDPFEALGSCTTLECVSALHTRLSAAGAKFNFPHFFLVGVVDLDRRALALRAP